MELEEGIFYQMSYDGTYVPIIANYPGLLPASYVSNPKTPYPEETSSSFLPTALFCAQKGKRSACRTALVLSPKRVYPTPGEPSKRKTNEDTAGPSSRGMDLPICTGAVTSNRDLPIFHVPGRRCAGLYPEVRAAVVPAARTQTLP